MVLPLGVKLFIKLLKVELRYVNDGLFDQNQTVNSMDGIFKRSFKDKIHYETRITF